MEFDHSLLTKAVHAGTEPEPITGAIMTPIFQTSTYVQKSPGEHKGFEYSRADNPTRKALEEALAILEGGRWGLSFSSGLAAEQAVIQILNPGSRVLVCDDVYGGTGRLFRTLFARYGFDFRFVDMRDFSRVESCLSSDTAMIWVESPSNPMMKVIDIRKMSEYAKSVGAILVVDNTFCSPIFQNPLELGADIVIHSATKYLGGHSDLIGGAVMLTDPELYEKLKYVQFAGGAVPGPFECFMLLRSIKTLAVRMRQHEENAMKLAQLLRDHPRVSRVFYPGLPEHPDYHLAQKQMRGFSGMMSFELKDGWDGVLKFLKRLNIFALAESLGGVESLVNHPERMTHASVPVEMRKTLGITPGLLRLSVGIEYIEDLAADLQSALDYL
ncbi:MAG: PLP-dependent transferase [Deltaproteobacteria bacterium]|nr:PLP-dependent transferase [Deltaproteobacteria bacterium]